MDTNVPSQNTPASAPKGPPESKVRSGIIFGAVGLFAAIVFGLIYLFVLAPTIPDASVGWFLFSFATGLTMIVLPCTLPLAFVIVPLSMGKGLVRGLGMALAFGIGVTVTLSLYGVAAALLGGLAIDSLGTDLEVIKNWVYFVAGLFALIFALSEIGLLNIHMPTYSGAAPAFIQKRGELVKAFMLGLFLGNIGVGCPHPATPLILIEIASSGDILYGWLMFLVHAIGRILPLLLLAFLAILGVNGLNWLLTRKDTVERTTGWAMVFVAGFILTLGLFTHDWWVNSGLHSALEVVTQESRMTSLINETLETDVAHVHGLEEGVGLFGQPLWWGNWFLVAVWLIPIWWWWLRKRRRMLQSPAFRLRELEKEIDRLEQDRRQVESMVDMDALDPSFDLAAHEAQLDQLEEERRTVEKKLQYGETGIYKEPLARDYEEKLHMQHRNYLIVVSIFLALTFIYFLPENFYLRATNPSAGHHGGEHAHDDSHAHGKEDLEGLHAMPDGTVMNAAGEVFPDAHVMGDGSIMLGDGTTVSPDGSMSGMGGMMMGAPFTKSTEGLPDARGLQFVELADGDTYDLTASYVKKEIGNRTLRMMAYNGSIPGPFISVPQGGEITVNFTNDTDIEQTIHSHGVRVDNRFDGVPYVTQDPVMPGETFTYTLNFDDPGAFWYHPHTREDYGQELGLYGNYFIEPSDPGYWNPVNREMPLVLDDILIDKKGTIETFYKETTNFALLGRFGNTHLVNGVEDYTTTVRTGEVVRFFITNVANTRPYNLSIPGAQLKLVGADLGKYEREEYVDSLIISPAERLVVEAYFPEAGTYNLMHSTPDSETELARFLATNELPPVSYAEEFNVLRTNTDVVDTFAAFREFQNQPPDKDLLLTIDIPDGMVDHSAHAHMDHGGDSGGSVDHSEHAHMQADGDRMSGIQWDDPGQSDRMNTTHMIQWELRDRATGKSNMDIDDWTFTEGDLVKIRLTNDAEADHVMQHPIHLHGQRFVVLSENGEPNENLAWKDTVLVFPGETADILVDMVNPGEWMSHCHIAEHLHAGMMLTFRVEDENGFAPGDAYRSTVDQSELDEMHAPGEGMEGGMMRDNEAESMNASGGPAAEYSFGDSVQDPTYSVNPSTKLFAAGKEEQVVLSFVDSGGNPVALEDTIDRALTITFVKSDNSVAFETYPGNDTFPVPREGVGDDHGHDDGHDHEHSFRLIPEAYAHGDTISDDHHAGNISREYTVPVLFPEPGIYRGFVEFTLAGEQEPRVATFDVEVGSSRFNIDNFGWSNTTEKLILSFISILFVIPIVLAVRRYLNPKNV